ncbi:MAG: ferredoxin [Defluviicoccus sp.]|nr:ferredoxin [Defluviicoccus sp.]MDE0386786.1 ferredoxin [Defluviicoccus sp.]
MRVRVDPDRCEGHSRCHALAPELFEPDDFGNATALRGGAVPPGLERKARLAAANCPEYAVEVVEDAG